MEATMQHGVNHEVHTEIHTDQAFEGVDEVFGKAQVNALQQ